MTCAAATGDVLAEYLLNEMSDDDFEDDPCPDCGGRVMHCRPQVSMEEEEYDC